MNTNIHLITFSILLFTNFQTNKQRSSGLDQHYIFLLTNNDFIALNISVNNLLGIQLLPSILVVNYQGFTIQLSSIRINNVSTLFHKFFKFIRRARIHEKHILT